MGPIGATALATLPAVSDTSPPTTTPPDAAPSTTAPSTTAPPTDAAPTAQRRRYLAATTTGAVTAVALFVVVMLWGQGSVLGDDVVGGFYDAQAHALVDGHLDVDPVAVGFEGFRMDDGRTYIYQGLVPALARVPVVAAFGDRFDGRLTRPSMVVAFGVIMAYAVSTVWSLRRSLRGAQRSGAAELTTAGLFTFAAGASSLLFLAGKSWVYHEAILWGVAFALAGYHHLFRWAAGARSGRGGTSHLVVAAVAAALALNTRASVGLGPVVAVGLAALAIGVRTLADRRSEQWAVRLRNWCGWTVASWRSFAVAVGGLASGVLLYVAVNVVRFGSLFGVPLDRQVLVAADLDRQAALAANGNSLFGLRFIPSVLWQTVRPDAVSFRSTAPWLGFPGSRPAVFGSAVFAERDWSTSVTVAEPVLVALAVVGLLAVIIGRHPRQEVRLMRVPLAGAAAGAAVYVAFAYIANRYLSDVWPFLFLGAAVGLHVVLGRSDGSGDRGTARGTSRGAGSRVAAVALPVLVGLGALWGAWANSAMALQYRFEVAAGTTASARADWLESQTGGSPPSDLVRVASGDELPHAERIGTVAVVGDCDAVYRSNGRTWFLLFAGRAGGGFDVSVDIANAPDEPVTLLATDDPAGDRLVLEPVDGRFRLVVLSGDDSPQPRRSLVGSPFDLRDGDRLDLSGSIDQTGNEVFVTNADGDVLLHSTIDSAGTPPLSAVGGDGVEVEVSDPPDAWCRRMGLGG